MVGIIQRSAGLCSGVTDLLGHVKEAFRLCEVPVQWNGRKIYSILQNTCVFISAVSIICAIVTPFFSASLFLLSITVATLSLVGSHLIKKKLYIPPPPLPKLNERRMKELVEHTKIILDEQKIELDPNFQNRLFKHFLNKMDPEVLSEKERKSLETDFEKPKPIEYSSQIEKDVDINNSEQFINQMKDLEDYFFSRLEDAEKIDYLENKKINEEYANPVKSARFILNSELSFHKFEKKCASSPNYQQSEKIGSNFNADVLKKLLNKEEFKPSIENDKEVVQVEFKKSTHLEFPSIKFKDEEIKKSEEFMREMNDIECYFLNQMNEIEKQEHLENKRKNEVYS